MQTVGVLYYEMQIPVPVGKCHHDIQRCQEKHKMEEGITVSNSIPFVIYGTVNIISIIKGAIVPGHSILYQS